MASVYANSYLTISAASCEGSAQGFVKAHADSDQLQCELSAITGAPGHFVHIRPHEAVKPRTFLTQRAWAFQERLLSPRVLHFTSHDMVFECDTRTFYEGGPESHRSSLAFADKRLVYESAHLQPSGKYARIQLYDKWLRIVEEYSGKQLSFETDRFPALSGIAVLWQKQIGDEYVAGLWKEDMVAGLLWACFDTALREKPPVYVAPSWSWASAPGEVAFHRTPRHYMSLEILHVETKLSTSNRFGEISSACLTVRGPLKTFPSHHLGYADSSGRNHTVDYTWPPPSEVQLAISPLTQRDVKMSVMFDRPGFAQSDSIIENFWCLACTSNQSIDSAEFQQRSSRWCEPVSYDLVNRSHNAHGLVLERCDAEMAVYRRVGVFQIEDVSWMMADWHHLGFEDSTLTIV